MVENYRYEKIVFTKDDLENEYYGCVFEGCDFSNLNLAEKEFEDCEFKACNFSLCKLSGTLRNVLFHECKMVGADFSHLNPFSGGLRFEQTQLDFALFSGLKQRKLQFSRCSMLEVNFEGADVVGSLFDHCTMERALFHHTNV